MEKRDVSYYYKAAQSNKTKVAMRQLRGTHTILTITPAMKIETKIERIF